MNTDTDMNINKKTVCLIMLLSGTRVNTMIHLKVTNMYITGTECIFVFDEGQLVMPLNGGTPLNAGFYFF